VSEKRGRRGKTAHFEVVNQLLVRFSDARDDVDHGGDLGGINMLRRGHAEEGEAE
jgi:hypothetical protein